MSAAQFATSSFSEDVLATIDRYGVAPDRLVIELTESVFAEQVERVRGHLTRLHDAGLGISLDDFGTGYSSFGYLRDYPIDQIKIDRTFVAGILSDTYRAAVIGAVVDIAATVGATLPAAPST